MSAKDKFKNKVRMSMAEKIASSPEAKAVIRDLAKS